MNAGDDGDRDPAHSGDDGIAGFAEEALAEESCLDEQFADIMYSLPADVIDALDAVGYADSDLNELSYNEDGIATLRMHHVTDINFVEKYPIQWLVDGVQRCYGPNPLDYTPDPDFLVKALRIYEALLENPQTSVRVVAGKGCICRIPECNIQGCGEVFAPHDRKLMEKYGIEGGKVYTVEELMSSVHIGKEYYMTTTIVLGYDGQGTLDPSKTKVLFRPDHWIPKRDSKKKVTL